MPTLSIELTEDEHRRLQEGATKAGRDVGEYVRTRVLAELDDLAELASLLKPRIERADAGGNANTVVSDIARAARAKYSG